MKTEIIYQRKNLHKDVTKNKKGVTLISLVITIIVLLILAGVTITTITGGGIFDSAQKAKLKTEVLDIQERLEKKQIVTGNYITEGEINTILGIQSAYNDKLKIENGKIVYKNNKWTEKEIEMLEDLGIYISEIDRQNAICAENPTTYYIVDETNVEKYGGTENIGSMWDLADMKLANNFKNSSGNSYTTIIMLEDVNLNCNEENQWTPITPSTIFDGGNHTINGIYINSTNGNAALFSTGQNCTIKNVTLDNGYICSTGNNVAGIIGDVAAGTSSIVNCVNKVEVHGAANVGGIIGYVRRPNSATIEGCINYGEISSESYCSGIAGRIVNDTGRCCNNKKLL